MSDAVATDWTKHEQAKNQIEYNVLNKRHEEISAYIEMCIERGMSNYFISGLEVAANMVLFGPPQREESTEVTL